jgi:translocation protein SEC66
MIETSVSSIAPVAYFVLVLGSLITFNILYRAHKAKQSANLEPWFPVHHSRDIYLTLLHLDPPCPPSMLKAALLERAKEDISRVYALREQKVSAHHLLQKGSLAETTFQRIENAEKELNAEIQDVVAEAGALGGEEWMKSILAQANECYQKEVVVSVVEKAKKMAEEERRRWDEHMERKKVIEEKRREIALKELGGEGTEEGTTTSKKKKKNKK